MLLVAFVACNPAPQAPSFGYLPVPPVTPKRPVQPVQDYDDIIARNHPYVCDNCNHPELHKAILGK